MVDLFKIRLDIAHIEVKLLKVRDKRWLQSFVFNEGLFNFTHPRMREYLFDTEHATESFLWILLQQTS